MSSELNSIDFSLPSTTDRDIDSVRTVQISSNAASHTESSNNILRFVVSGSGREFLDGGGVQMYATIASTGTGVRMVASGSLFSQFRILTMGGDVLENIQDANVLNRILRVASASKAHDDTVGSFSNSQRTVADRAESGTFKIAVSDISGLLNSDKLLPLGAAGGAYVIELTMLSATASIMVTTAAAGTPTLTLTNARLLCPIVRVTESYYASFQQQLASGVPLFYHTYSSLTNSVSAAGAHSLSLGKRASKLKHVWTVLRRTADLATSLNKSSDAFTSAGLVSYQMSIGGQQFPPSAINNYSQAYEEFTRTAYSDKDCHHASLTLAEYSTDWAIGSQEQGCLVLATDLEKSQLAELSGLEASGVDTIINLNMSSTTVATTVTSFLCFERVVIFQAEGGVVIQD